MYRKKSRGWYKHKDFILIDLICLFLSLLIAHLIRNGSVQSLFRAGIYRNMISFVILADLFLIIIFESYKGVLRRGHYQELHSVIRQMILLELASGLYLFTVSDGHSFSRTVLYLMGVFYVFLSYGTRIAWKKHLIHKMAEGGEHSLYIVTNYDQAAKVIQNVKEHNYNRYNINGLIIVDKNAVGRKISGIPVVAELENAASYICQQWVDEVFVNIDESYSYPDELIQELLEMGMVVHVNLAKVKSTSGQKQFVETVGGYTVLTTTMNYATDRQAFAKRALDILGGLVGCFLTGIIFIFVAPAIYISSPGPIFFSQTRIGQNGKPFKMYKFRSMYMDAEERKAELMAQNKMSPVVWDKYLRWQEHKNHGKVVKVDFRNKKDFGWKDHVETIWFDNGKNVSSPIFKNLFYGHMVLRPSCYECPYKSIMHPGDITIADYWGIEKAAPEFDDNKGVSLVLVNNEKADSIFENVKIELKWKSTRIEDSMQPPLKAPFPKPEGREQFWNDVNDKSFSYIARAYGDNGTANYIKKVLRRAKRKIQHLISKT